MTRSVRVAGLYAIVDAMQLDGEHMMFAVRAAIDGGARVIQYRDKRGNDALVAATSLRALCRERDALFLVNDDVALARSSGADGVHIGRDDASIEYAREHLGPRAVIGVSCYNELPRALAAADSGCDYVAFGSFYPSVTKPGAVRASPKLLSQARALLRVPVVAIGGITPENGAALVAAGADALAVINGLFAADDIAAQARRYMALFRKSQSSNYEPHHR